MDFPLIVGPMERGRNFLSSLAPVRRPDLSRTQAPTCTSCGSILSEDITEKMDVRGLKYCPVCVLSEVHPLADPEPLTNITTVQEIRSLILDTYGNPPDNIEDQEGDFPGVYILWSPPREGSIEESLNLPQRLGNAFVSILNAANGNGLLYVGQSKDVARRVWEHCGGAGAKITKIMPPTKLVAVNWKPPSLGLRTLENQVGKQVAKAVKKHGYDLGVYYD